MPAQRSLLRRAQLPFTWQTTRVGEQPAGDKPRELLWTALRLCWLSAVRAAHCGLPWESERSHVKGAGLVAATVAGIQQLIRRDVSHTAGDVQAMEAAPTDWSGSRTAAVPSQGLVLERWAANEVLSNMAHVKQGRGLLMFLPSTHPVGLPLRVVIPRPAVLVGPEV